MTYLIFFLTGPAARAEGTNEYGLSDKDLDRYLLKDVDLGVSLWDESYGLRAGVGYKDNVLLDHTDPKASPFFTSGLDITLFRLPADDWEFYLFVTGDDIRYWQPIGVGSEDLWAGGAKLQRDLGGGWLAGITASYAYEDQVLDLLNNNLVVGSFAPAVVIGHTITLRPSLRRDLGTNYWVELELEGTRQFFDAPAFSYWRAGTKFTVGKSYGHHSEITLSYDLFGDLYDSEAEADPDGNDIPGTQLREIHQEEDLAWRHYWDEKRRWESTTKLSFEYCRDIGTGYYDYFRYWASEQLDWRGRSWNVRARAELVHYDYPYEEAEDLTDPNNPIPTGVWTQTGYTLNLRLEKRVLTWLKLYMEYEYEHSLSNQSATHYQVNTITGGAQWDF
jgi:hypothetical protein